MFDTYELQNNITKILRENEELLWQGQPNINKKFAKSDIFFVPFSILWFGFSIFWEIGAASASAFLMLFGLPFVSMGMYITFGRFIYKKHNKEHTYYFVTNQRVIIYNNYRKEKFSEIGLHTIGNLSIDVDKHGIGTITFDSNNTAAPLRQNNYYPNTGMDFFMGGTMPNAFYDIDNAHTVYELISNQTSQNQH